MSVVNFAHDCEPAATMPTYRRTMSPNEISYFLPSRAYGLNDMFCRLIFRAPPSLVSPLRIHIVWAIIRLRHSLMACRFEMEPGCYDDAQFAYTPPCSPSQALAEAAACVRVCDDVSGPELMQEFLSGPRTLSADRLSALHVADHGEVSPGMNEYHLMPLYHHGINDGLAMMGSINLIVELLGGPATPGGTPRSDVELARLLDDEWKRRWGIARDPDDVIVAATEARILGLPRSKLAQAAWKVDHQLVQRRFIGGHVFPRLKNRVAECRILQVKFSVSQTAAILAKCKSKGVTFQNAVFALCNLAWIRLYTNHPEINAPQSLPMLMYTAISIRRYLTSASPLSSHMSLALEYFNVVLPAFLPTSADPRAIFWARSRAVQKQMFAYSHSPLLLGRSVMTSAARGRRAKVFAREDDEADGTLLPRLQPAQPPSPVHSASGAKPAPSAALLGISQIGDIDPMFPQSAYPAIQLVDLVGGVRKAPGGINLFTRKFLGRVNMVLVWDAAAFAPGLMEEFWRYVVDGVHDYVLEDPSGTVEELEPLALVGPSRARSKL